MAYIPWWQRRLAPTLAERFELGGLAGQQLVKKTDELRPGFAGVTKNVKNVEGIPYLNTAESGTGKKFYLVKISTQNTEAGPGLKRRFPLTEEGKAEAIKAIKEHKEKYPNIFKREIIKVGEDGIVRYYKKGGTLYYDPKEYGSLEKAMVEGAAGQGAGDDNETVLITFPNTGTAGNLNYAQICEVISGALQGRNNKNFTVIADQANGNYLYPLTSTVTITPGA